MDEVMQAVVIRKQGAPDVLELSQVPIPKLKAGEALIRVKACALNHLDIWCRSSLPGVKLPLILGCDVSGEVAAVDELATSIKVGDRVLIAPGMSCGFCRQCLCGDEHLCRQYKVLGEHCDGGYAEYVAVPATNCFPIPGKLNFPEAAAVPLVFITAWHMLMARANLQMGETLLVIGGGSGVGSAAIQIGKLMHARVIATVGSDDKAELAKKLGADAIINHTNQSIATEIKRLTQKRGVDVVFEHVGAAVWNDCLLSMATNGRLVTCGATSGSKVELDVPRLFMKNQTILGSMMGTKAEFMQMLPFFAKGVLKPVVSNVFPLSEARAAHELLESRRQFGKIVLDPSLSCT